MTDGPALVDSDVLSELARGNPRVTRHVQAYLERHGRLTVSAVSIFERLRGYRAALRLGKPFDIQLRQFEVFAATCLILPVDRLVADRAATIWNSLGVRRRRALGDILIAATAWAHHLPLVTRNRRDFEAMLGVDGIGLELRDWSR